MSEYQYVEHEFAPVYNEESQVLVLGSLPSVKSREQGFYYGHPRNRFWKVVAAVLGVPRDVSKVVSDNLDLKNKIEKIELMNFSTSSKEQQVISILDIIEEIRKNCDGELCIQNLGQPDVVVYYKAFDPSDRNTQMERMSLTDCCSKCFCQTISSVIFDLIFDIVIFEINLVRHGIQDWMNRSINLQLTSSVIDEQDIGA